MSILYVAIDLETLFLKEYLTTVTSCIISLPLSVCLTIILLIIFCLFAGEYICQLFVFNVCMSKLVSGMFIAVSLPFCMTTSTGRVPNM